MATVKRFEHPSDRRPCEVCKLKPVNLKPTQVETVGACVRCGTPYHHDDDDNHLLPHLVIAIEKVFVELAIRAWALGMQIDVRPFLPPDSPIWNEGSVTGSANAREEGLEPGDFCLTDFEKFIAEHRADWVVEPDETQVVEVFSVLGSGDGAHWRRATNSDDPPTEVWGALVIDPKSLPPGSTVVVIRKPDPVITEGES